MNATMAENPPTQRLVLVSCAACGCLHEPLLALSLNPVCPDCAAAAASEPVAADPSSVPDAVTPDVHGTGHSAQFGRRSSRNR